MFIKKIIAPAVALGLGAVLLTPGSSDGFSLFGFALGHGQRDFRVFNNFSDTATNNNQTPHVDYPGAQGAVMAIWKGSVEWGSEKHGTGGGDPSQGTGLGSGGANFDPSYQGEVGGVGGPNDNIHSALSGGSGGVLAFTEGVGTNGWRIRYFENWTWSDGPGTGIGGQSDLQGVACHEYGHAIGLNHSGSGSATMAPSIGGGSTSERSINSDDINGVKAAYGTMSASKPHISGVSTSSGNITITGTGFNSSGNQIWFTRGSGSGNGTPIKVTNLASNGTTLTAAIPANAGPGDVLVRRNSTAHSGLSNAFPTDLTGSGGGGGAPMITAVTPSIVEAITVDGQTLVTLSGSGFTGTTSIAINGIVQPVLPPSYVIINDSTLAFNMTTVDKLGAVEIKITNMLGVATGTVNVIPNAVPTVEMKNSNPNFLIQGLGLDIKIGGTPGDLVYLVFSPSLVPTPGPGVINMPLGLGNGGSSLLVMGPYAIGTSGHHDINVAVQGLPGGFTVNTQTVHAFASNAFALPWTVSNVQSGQILF